MKKEEKTEKTKRKILSFAIQEFGTHGYHAASLNNICSVGIPKGLLYHNYESKDAVYLACVKQCYTDLLNIFKDNEPMKDLKTYLAVRLQFFEEHPDKSQVIFEAMIQPPENLRTQLDTERKEFDEFNLIFYERILESLHLRKNISKQDAIVYFSMMQSMFNVYFNSDLFRKLSISECVAEHEKKLPQFLEFMLYGIVEQKGDM